MTYAQEIHKLTPEICYSFLDHLLCKSGTGFILHQLLAYIRTVLQSKPKTGMHETK